MGEPWNSRRQDLPMRKDRIQATRYGLTPLAVSMAERDKGLTLSKPLLISRRSVESFLLSIWRVLIS